MNLDSAREDLKEAQRLSSRADEEAMYGPLLNALNALAPRGFKVQTLETEGAKKPDMSLVRAADSALCGYIEVKKPKTVGDAFKVGPDGSHQIDNYRNLDSGAVLLTDAKFWWDVTESDDLGQPFAVADLAGEDVDSPLRAVADKLAVLAGKRPRYASATACAIGIASLVEQIEQNPGEEVKHAWEIIRSGLNLDTAADGSLDTAGAGEVIVFSLLGLAVTMNKLPDDTFVDMALQEWDSARNWTAEGVPQTLARTFQQFRVHATGKVSPELWVGIRAIAHWVHDDDPNKKWSNLSDLWDTHLHRTGRRARLGSWQTPKGVADYQVAQVDEALARLGYEGVADPDVTVLDPCAGTGVYLAAVIDHLVDQGLPPQATNASETDPYPRLVGVDISPTAVATSHIRMSSKDAGEPVRVVRRL